MSRTGRHAAGEDPLKRAQILEGATQVFMKLGFADASMNDVARKAGVSKGTIYVYFANKEDLFCTIILETRERIFSDLSSVLEADDSIRNILRRFAITLASGLMRDETIRAMQMAIGVAERFPMVVRTFFGASPDNLSYALRQFIERQCREGQLSARDPHVAAMQFIALCTGHMWKLRLFGIMEAPPSLEQIEILADDAVAMFLKSYAP